jgi:hypothetical protein
MIERASIRFYSVKHCGLYKPHARNCTLGSFSQILDNIYNWALAPGRLIQNTCTYEVNEDFDMEFLETYLVSAKKCATNGDMLFSFWNRTHASGSSVYALDAAAQLDNVSEDVFHQGNLPESSIPGFATYFLFMPSKSVMATITFGNPRSGMSAFSYWLENFLKTESRYVHFDASDQFSGYRCANGTIYNDLEPRFIKSLYKNPSKRNMILANRENIRGIVRRINLDRAQPSELDVFDRLRSLFGASGITELNDHEVSLKYELSYTPSATELDEIISAYDNSLNRTNWEDVGLLFPDNNSFGANGTEWLSKSFAKTKIAIEVDWVLTGQLINGNVLLASIGFHRQDLLELLITETEEGLLNVS